MAAETSQTIYIVDDDESVRVALTRLFRSSGRTAIALSSVEELLRCNGLKSACCIVADLRLAGADGFAIPGELRHIGINLPVIIVTAHDTEKVREQARRAGVVAFFHKPVDDRALLDAIDWAVAGTGSQR